MSDQSLPDRRAAELDLAANLDRKFEPATVVVQAPDGYSSNKVIFTSGHTRFMGSAHRIAVTKPEADELVRRKALARGRYRFVGAHQGQQIWTFDELNIRREK